MTDTPAGQSPDGLLDLARSEGRTLAASALRLTKIAAGDGPNVSVTVAGVMLAFTGASSCVSITAKPVDSFGYGAVADATDLLVIAGVLAGIADTLATIPTTTSSEEF